MHLLRWKSPAYHVLSQLFQVARTNQPDINRHTLVPISSTRIEVGFSYLSAIRHFHISHSAPYLPPQIYNLCFSILLGITAVPREIENHTYVKVWGANMVHYGKCKGDVLTIFIETTMHLVLPPPPRKRGCITIVSNFSWVS